MSGGTENIAPVPAADKTVLQPAAKAVEMPDSLVPPDAFEAEVGAHGRKRGRKPLEEEARIGRHGWNDIENVPPLLLDGHGFAREPRGVSAAWFAKMPENERMVRFAAWYNFLCGNVSLACRRVGVARSDYERWHRENERFVRALREANAEIADRAAHLMFMRMGLIPQPSFLRIHDGALFGFVKQLRPELFAKEINVQPSEPSENPNLPRPDRPA